jgi:hypothetical protein
MLAGEMGARVPLASLRARPGALPLGAILGAIGLVGALVVRFGGLAHLGLTLCTLKALTGIPCPSCGGTRAVELLARFDLAGAWAMNPLVTALALLVIPWALADAWLWPRGKALELSVAPPAAAVLRVLAVVVVLVNWLYLVLAGR